MKFFGFIGKKLCMSSFFDNNGNYYPVTKIDFKKNNVLKIKSKSVVVSYKGFKKEFCVDKSDFCYILGQEVNNVSVKDVINITSKSKGKGFSGVIKRHNFKSNRKTHGNSKSHNKPGSIGMCQDPGKVFKGKKMAGRMGFNNTTIKNLIIKKVDYENCFLYVYGSVPGKRNTILKIFPND